ncbi:hypothetical protein BDV93DRAFT_566535 [Ceratobasidium sp. AG-I]|nr:hypothetical protein BDV93DRAFT_566535 [Ceratobasidium sp. AG-I]
MRFAAVLALSLVGATLAAPAPIALKEDGKLMIGRDGKTTSPAERDMTGLQPRICSRLGCKKVAVPISP